MIKSILSHKSVTTLAISLRNPTDRNTHTYRQRHRETFFGGSYRLDPRLLDLARAATTSLLIWDVTSSPTFCDPPPPISFII